MSKIKADRIEAEQKSQIDLEDLPVDTIQQEKVQGSSNLPRTPAYSIVIDRRAAINIA